MMPDSVMLEISGTGTASFCSRIVVITKMMAS